MTFEVLRLLLAIEGAGGVGGAWRCCSVGCMVGDGLSISWHYHTCTSKLETKETLDVLGIDSELSTFT